MTKKEIAALAAAVRMVAGAGEANQLTVRAIAQALETTLWDIAGEKAAGFKTACTGVIDLSGTDYLTKVGAR